MKRSVLVVDDERIVRESLCERLELEGHYAIGAEDAETALEILRDESIHIVVIDVNLPGMNGLDLLKRAIEVSPGTSAVIMTGHGNVRDAVAAIQSGAEDYLQKPFEMEEMKIVLERIARKQAITDENVELKRRLREIYGFEGIIGRSAAMRRVFERAAAVAKSDANVLIDGETGSGKDLIARAIYKESARRDKPFVKVDCAALPETLLESELFGHERGAFTGATRAQTGRFEQADGGVIFLDEIGNLSPATQAKLLNVTQDRQFTRLGGERRINVDIRLISATNIDLEKAVADGRFREDLFYRLNVVPITIPSLRERREDIPLLVDAFIDRFCQENNRPNPGITAEAMEMLCSYDWPGNVRELENAIERTVILSGGGKIGAADLPARMSSRSATANAPRADIPVDMPLKKAVERFEAALISSLLRELGGSRDKTSRRLGVTRVTLYNKMKKYGLLDNEE